MQGGSLFGFRIFHLLRLTLGIFSFTLPIPLRLLLGYLVKLEKSFGFPVYGLVDYMDNGVVVAAEKINAIHNSHSDSCGHTVGDSMLSYL